MSRALPSDPRLDAVHRRLARDGEAWRERVALDPAPRGLSVARLAREPDLAGLLVREAGRRIEEATGRDVPTWLAATRVLHDYAWPAGLVFTAPWHVAGLLPVVEPDDVRIEPATGLLRVRASAEARRDASADDVRRAVVAHHEPLVAALEPLLRRGPRAVWGTVADDLVSGVWWLGRLLGDEAGGVAAATRLVASAEPPLPSGAGFRSLVAGDGSEHVIRTRVACCFRYAIEPEACGTCPRLSDAERRARLAC